MSTYSRWTLFLLLFSFVKMQAQTEATFYTNQGNFTVELYDVTMPITAGNFYSLVQAKFYDGIIFHRVINNFMIQGGDPNGNGTGGPGYTIQDEFVTGISNVQKTISMANSGPNSGGSQFFINLVNNTYLDFDKAPLTSAHPVFGITKTNFSVVQSIGAVATNASNRPLVDVIMDSIRITKTGPLTTNYLNNQIAEVDVFPNPILISSKINIQVKSDKLIHLKLINQSGALIYSGELSLKQGLNSISFADLKLGQLASGIYYIGISDSKGIIYKKISMLN